MRKRKAIAPILSPPALLMSRTIFASRRGSENQVRFAQSAERQVTIGPARAIWIIRGRKLLIWKRPPPDPLRLTHRIYSDDGMSSMAVAKAQWERHIEQEFGGDDGRP